MDPNFVQHDLTDLATRFLGYLVVVLAYSTAIHGGVNATFRTIGIDIRRHVWDDVVKGFVALVVAVGLDLNLFFYVAGITNDQFVGSAPLRHGLPSSIIPPAATILLCNLMTGTLILGGKKVIISVAEDFTAGYSKIKELLDRKTAGGQ